MAERMRWLSEISPMVWHVLAGASGVQPGELRSSCVSAGQRAIAFVQFRVFNVAERLLTLCRGCVEQNLRDLAAGARSSDEVAANIYDLTQRRHPLSVVARLVTLIGDLGWTTAVTEQLHAHAAIAARFHPEYGLNMVQAKEMVQTMCKLLPSSTKADKELAKVQRALGALERKDPSKHRGHNQYFADLVEVVGRKFRRARPQTRQLVNRGVMKQHMGAYRKKSDRVRRRYAHVSRAQASLKQQQNRTSRDGMVQDLARIRTEVAREKQERPPLFLRFCAWGDLEMGEGDELLKDDAFDGHGLAVMRDRAAQAPSRMSEELTQALEDEDIQGDEQEPRPEWIHALAAQRAHFEGVALVVDVGGERQVIFEMPGSEFDPPSSHHLPRGFLFSRGLQQHVQFLSFSQVGACTQGLLAGVAQADVWS
ncbi:unnamed protein product [Prorocentrum cordatum]|uniref:Uncharacterized protein n=1 Tax=Prorocentrum cordatum TaxID=2364126 RepID=A0ABN9QPZ0_9DINO|nr:unnamed protein product [Polarella glacialis]